jgi:hypothetical protein
MAKWRLSEMEIEGLVAGYEASGKTRQDDSRMVGIAVTTLDYYRARQARKRRGGLVRVELAGSGEMIGQPMLLEAGGRRLQWMWDGGLGGHPKAANEGRLKSGQRGEGKTLRSRRHSLLRKRPDLAA